MKIQFENVEEKRLPAFNGGDGEFLARMQIDELGKILKGRLKKGCSIGEHLHGTSSEMIYILSGQGVAVCNGEVEHLQAGDCHYCPKGSTHTLRNDNDEDLVFFAVIADSK